MMKLIIGLRLIVGLIDIVERSSQLFNFNYYSQILYLYIVRYYIQLDYYSQIVILVIDGGVDFN